MRSFDDSYLYHIANLYYNHDLSQAEIAEREGLSRPQVSRMLTQAKQVGIVKIKVVMPKESKAEHLEASLVEKLGLKQVFIASNLPNGADLPGDEDAYISSFALRAAPILPRLLHDSKCIGLGWGRTMYNLARNLPEVNTSVSATKLIVPLVGSPSGIAKREIQVNTVEYLFGEKLKCNSFYLNMFSRVTPEQHSLEPLEEQSLKMLSEYWDTMDTAVFSSSNAYYAASNELFLESSEEKVPIAGDILLSLFYENGEVRRNRDTLEIPAIDLNRLKSIPKSILIAAGSEKVKSIYYAAKLQFCNILITDAPTAELLLKMDVPEDH